MPSAYTRVREPSAMFTRRQVNGPVISPFISFTAIAADLLHAGASINTRVHHKFTAVSGRLAITNLNFTNMDLVLLEVYIFIYSRNFIRNLCPYF